MAAIHYVFSVATMVWFLSLEPSAGAVPPNNGIDTSLPATIDMAMSNTKLIEEVFRQGTVRVINAFARTTGACTEPEQAAIANGTLETKLEKIVNTQQELAEQEGKVVVASRVRLDKLSNDLTEAIKRETSARLTAKSEPQNEKASNELTAASSWRRAVEAKQKIAALDVKRDVAAEQAGEHNITQTARGAAFTLRSCNESTDTLYEKKWRNQLREKMSQGDAKTTMQTQQGGKGSRRVSKVGISKKGGVRMTGGAVGPGGSKAGTAAAGTGTRTGTKTGTAAGLEKTIDDDKKVVELVSEDITLASKIVGCETAFNPATIPRLQGHLNSALDVLSRYLKPTTLIDMDKRMLAGEFAGVEFGAAPLQSPPNKALASIGFALLRPIIYGILGIIFAGYLAYTMASIPFAWLMNGIQDEFFTKPGTKLPLWKIWIERVMLLLTQSTVAFWTIPLWFMFGGSVFWITALVVMTPLAFGALAQSKRPWHQTMYYAAVAALPLTLVTMAIKGAIDLSNLLPEHSEVKTPALWAWAAWLFTTTALGTSAMMTEGENGGGRWLSRSAWVALLLLVAIPPLAVLAEH
jgi:hypothetical protein